MPKLSVTVITRNAATHLAEALASVAWADEIVVVDAQSTDDTAVIARQFASQVVVRAWPGYAEQKNFAASLASHDWILSLDADERVTPVLREEVQHVLEGPERYAAFRIPRVTWHLGRWFRSTDWYPDPQTRLYDRRRSRWTGRYVHETLSVDGELGRLREELLHFPYRDISDHLETINRYTTLAARQMSEAGRSTGLFRIVCHPPMAFLRNYIGRGGFRDGIPGLIVSSMNAYYVFLKLAKLWELQLTSTSRSTGDAKRLIRP